MAFQPIYAIKDRHGRGTLLPYNQGVNDGSTLTLDFTTGVIDPRLTFTRGSNATFINSSGWVQYAASNQLSNSVFVGASGATGPTGWLVSFIGGTGNFSLSGTELTISNNGSADRSRIYQTGPTGNGLFVTVQMKIVANNTGGLSLAEIVAFSINGQSSVTYRVNGVTQTSSYTGWTAGDLVTLTCIPTVGSAATCLFGVGCSNNVAKSASVTIKDVQIEVGTTANTYNPTTTNGAYYAPRFDYDLTTGAPRGLLIEGTVSNIMFRSQAINTSPWFNAGTMTVSETGSGSPANDATSNVVTWTNGTGAGGAWLQQNVAVSAGSLVVGNAYTWSVWLKSRGGRRVNVFAVLQGATGNREVRVDFGVSPPTVTSTSTTGWTSIQAPTIVEYPNGWYKVTTGGTLPAGTTSVNFGFSNSDAVPASGTNGFEAWGYQLEAGSGASSYIPTGASTGQRLADSAVMNDIAPLNYSATNGSIYWSGIINKQPTSYITLVGFMTAIDQPAYETFGNALNYFTAARGATLNIGGSNEVSRPYVLGSLIKYASSVNTLQDPIVAVNLNGSASSINKAGTGDLRVATRFVIGRQPSNTYGAEYPSVTIRSIKYWPTSKVAAELAVLTA